MGGFLELRRQKPLSCGIALAIVLLVVMMSAYGASSTAAAPAGQLADVTALLEVKQGFRGAAGILDDWSLANASLVCNWTGISCGPAGRVTTMLFVDKGLQGVLSPAIANVTELEYLRIFNAPGLTGPVPKEVATLKKMNFFDLCSCSFSGVIPRELGRLSNLRFFSLAQNTLSGEIPLELMGLTNLTFFSLFANSFTGPIPPAMGRLTKLQTLTIQYNNFSGPIPTELSACTGLSFLDLSVNQLSGPLPAQLADLQNLTTLDLSSNALTGKIPDGYGNLTALATLSLAKNALSGPIPAALGSLPLLQTLDLSWNGLSGPIPNAWGAAANLSSVDLSMNNLTGPIPDSFSNLQNLTTFNVSGNQLSGPVPPGALSSLVPSSYGNNSRLCGPPLQTPCSDDEEIMGAAGIAGTVVGGVVLLCIALSSALKLHRGRRPAREFANGQVRLFQPLGYPITVDDILAATDNFSKKHLLGSGSSSRVYWAKLPDGKTEVAVKRLLDARARGVSKQFHAETSTLSSARHANLVTLIGSYLEEATGLALLIYTFLPGGDLETWLAHAELAGGSGRPPAAHSGAQVHSEPNAQQGAEQPDAGSGAQLAASWSGKGGSGGRVAAVEDPLTQWWVRYKIAFGAAKGLRYLHHECKPPIVHRDIKTANIFLDDDLNAYVGDFGLSKVLADAGPVVPAAAAPGGERSAALHGTVGYLAPESARRGRFTQSADVYSFGVVVLELLTGVRPTADEVSEEGYPAWVRARLAGAGAGGAPRGIFDPRIDLGDEHSRARSEALAVLEMALDCTAKEPKRRPTMADVVRRLEDVRNFHVDVVIDP